MISLPAKLFGLVASLSIVGLVATPVPASQQTEDANTIPKPQKVVNFLIQSVDWYRSSPTKQQLPSTAEDVPFLEDTRSLSLEILQLSFDSARALAHADARDPISFQQAAVIPEPSAVDTGHFTSIESKCQADAQGARANVPTRDNKADTHRERDRAKRRITLEEAETRLNLIEAQCRSYQQLHEFVRDMNSTEPQNQGLDSIIEELSRTVPDLANTGAVTPVLQRDYDSALPNGSSIPEAISKVLKLRRKLHAPA